MKLFKLVAASFALLFSLAACQNAGLGDVGTDATDYLTFRIVSGDATKTQLGENGLVQWQDGDQVGFYTPNSSFTGAGTAATVKIVDNKPTFTVTFDKEVSEGGAIYAYYPCTLGWLSIFYRLIYNDQFAGMSTRPLPMVSKPVEVSEALAANTGSTYSDIEFYNLATVLRLTVGTEDESIKNEQVERIVVSADETMSGFALVDPLPTLFAGEQTDESLKMRFCTEATFEKFGYPQVPLTLSASQRNSITMWNKYNPDDGSGYFMTSDGIIADLGAYYEAFKDETRSQVYDIVAAPGDYTDVKVVVFTDKAQYEYSVRNSQSVAFERNKINVLSISLTPEKRLPREDRAFFMVADTLYQTYSLNDGKLGQIPDTFVTSTGYRLAGWCPKSDQINPDPSEEGYAFAKSGDAVNESHIYYGVFVYEGIKEAFFDAGDFYLTDGGHTTVDSAIDSFAVAYISSSDANFKVGYTKGYEPSSDEVYVQSLTLTVGKNLELSSVSLAQNGVKKLYWTTDEELTSSVLPVQYCNFDTELKEGETVTIKTDDTEWFRPLELVLFFYDRASYVIL